MGPRSAVRGRGPPYLTSLQLTVAKLRSVPPRPTLAAAQGPLAPPQHSTDASHSRDRRTGKPTVCLLVTQRRDTGPGKRASVPEDAGGRVLDQIPPTKAPDTAL